MKSRDWACWSFWILFSVFDLSIGVLLPEAEINGTSAQILACGRLDAGFRHRGWSGALLDDLANIRLARSLDFVKLCLYSGQS